MQIGFLRFIAIPVTDSFTVYTVMKSFLSAVNQLEQGHFPAFWDKGIYKILLDIYLKGKQRSGPTSK